MSSTSFHVLCQPLFKTQNSFVEWTCGKLSHFFLLCNFQFTNCFWLRIKLSKSFEYRSPNMIVQDIQILRVLNHLGTVGMQALLSDTCNERRAPHILLNLPLCLAAVGCSLQQALEFESRN